MSINPVSRTLGKRTDLSNFRIAGTITAFVVVAMGTVVIGFMCNAAFKKVNPSPFNAKWIIDGAEKLETGGTFVLANFGVYFSIFIPFSFCIDNSTSKKSLLSISRENTPENLKKSLFTSIDGADDNDKEMAASYLCENEAALFLYQDEQAGRQIMILYRTIDTRSSLSDSCVRDIEELQPITIQDGVNWQQVQESIFAQLKAKGITHLRIPSSTHS